MNTFTSFCIAACMFMCFVGMASAFIGVLGVFPTTISMTPSGNSSSGIFSNLTGNVTSSAGESINFDSIWLIATGGIAATGAFIFGILTKSTNMVAVWLFGTVFWSAWGHLAVIISGVGILDSEAGIILISIITVGMTIIFVGAVIGMLSGSIWMR